MFITSHININSCCVVPALVVDGRVTSDAHNIVLHADEFFPQTVKLFPNNEVPNVVKEQFNQHALCLWRLYRMER